MQAALVQFSRKLFILMQRKEKHRTKLHSSAAWGCQHKKTQPLLIKETRRRNQHGDKGIAVLRQSREQC